MLRLRNFNNKISIVLVRALIAICIMAGLHAPARSAESPSADFGRVAQSLLEHVRYQEPTGPELSALRDALPDDLYRCLDSERKKKAFWLNMYNALAQIAVTGNPGYHKNKEAFFCAKRLIIAGQKLSLDDIEHRLLRRAEPGTVPRCLRPLFMSTFMRRLSVAELDPRIHFALNCNARSCPPILFYDPCGLDAQLDAAALNYLKSSVACDPVTGRVELPELFLWFSRDFGGKTGIAALLRTYGMLGHSQNPVFVYRPWDWAPEPGNFH